MSSTASVPSRRVRVERGIYLQPNGRHAVCFMLAGKPRFRTVDGDLAAARAERLKLAAAARAGRLPVGLRLTLATVSAAWLERFAAMVALGERRQRTLDGHAYHLERHLLPALGHRRISALTVDDLSALIDALVAKGLAPRTIAGATDTLGAIQRFALRRGYITDLPLRRLEAGERPRAQPQPARALGRQQVADLLDATPVRYRTLIATALYTGLRISELLGLIWSDLDLGSERLHVRAQLSRGRSGRPARRVAPKTRAALREIPLPTQLVDQLRAHHTRTMHAGLDNYVFATARGTPLRGDVCAGQARCRGGRDRGGAAGHRVRRRGGDERHHGGRARAGAELLDAGGVGGATRRRPP